MRRASVCSECSSTHNTSASSIHCRSPRAPCVRVLCLFQLDDADPTVSALAAEGVGQLLKRGGDARERMVALGAVRSLLARLAVAAALPPPAAAVEGGTEAAAVEGAAEAEAEAVVAPDPKAGAAVLTALAALGKAETEAEAAAGRLVLVSSKARPFCCAPAVFLSKTAPFRAVPLPQAPGYTHPAVLAGAPPRPAKVRSLLTPPSPFILRSAA
eukprot:SAG22_NODE_1999_length_3178_cov_12.473530_5_plen_214_part_00